MIKRRTDDSKKRKSYKYRVYPNKDQKILISKTFGCARLVYNLLLSDRIDHYKETGEMLKREVTYYKKMDKFFFLKEVDSLALANALLNLNQAYENFFKGNAKFPKFKRKGKHDTYTTNNQIRKTCKPTIEIIGNHIKLPKVGMLKVRQHRLIGYGEVIKNVTVSRKAGRYYVSICVEYDEDVNPLEKQEINLDRVIGLDYSSKSLYADSNGDNPDYPKFYRKSEKKIAKIQRKMSKMQYQSERYKKMQWKLQRAYAKVANQRADFLHKLSNDLIDRYDVICLEDLDLSALKCMLKLGKSTSDNGFGMFRNMLKYKAEKKGKYVVKIDKWFASTKTCHVCGHKESLDLSIREWICPVCHTHHDRDVNAAINIKNEGYRVLMEG